MSDDDDGSLPTWFPAVLFGSFALSATPYGLLIV